MYAEEHNETLDQGAIVGIDVFAEWYPGSAGLILTPRCDIEQRKADFFTVCAAIPADEFVVGRADWKTYARRRDSLFEIIEEKRPRWHWLHPSAHFPIGAVADFELLTSVGVAQRDWVVLSQIESPWREQLCARYVGYAGRVGIPTISREQRNQWVQDALTGVGEVQ